MNTHPAIEQTPDLFQEMMHRPAPQQEGIGSVVKEGIDNLGNMLIDALDGVLSKTAKLALGALGASVAGEAVYSGGRTEEPGFESRIAAATPITLSRSQTIESPSHGQAITRAVSPYDVDIRDLGQFVPDTPQVAMAKSKENSIAFA